MFVVVFVCMTHERREGDDHFWTPEQRGKDLNVSGRSYDKHTEVGDRARIPGLERAHSSCAACMSLSETDKRERSWLQFRSEVRELLLCTLHTVCMARLRRACDRLFLSAVYYSSSYSQAPCHLPGAGPHTRVRMHTHTCTHALKSAIQ